MLGVDAEGGVRHSPQTFLGYEPACLAAYPVRAVLDADKCGLQVLDEFALTFGQSSGFLFAESVGAFFKDFECGGGVGGVVAVGTDQRRSE